MHRKDEPNPSHSVRSRSAVNRAAASSGDGAGSVSDETEIVGHQCGAVDVLERQDVGAVEGDDRFRPDLTHEGIESGEARQRREIGRAFARLARGR